jgi:phosphoglycolate phosphatase-like HAD superfamily hydrolase
VTGFELVVLDCDGVLVDTERLTVHVEARVLIEMGWPHTTQEVVDRWMGRSSAAQLVEVGARLGAEAARRFDEVMTAELLAALCLAASRSRTCSCTRHAPWRSSRHGARSSRTASTACRPGSPPA